MNENSRFRSMIYWYFEIIYYWNLKEWSICLIMSFITDEIKPQTFWLVSSHKVAIRFDCFPRNKMRFYNTVSVPLCSNCARWPRVLHLPCHEGIYFISFVFFIQPFIFIACFAEKQVGSYNMKYFSNGENVNSWMLVF